ncbi:hypothetical protein KXR94_16385 [Stutzerimonas stutzeri]
MPSRIWELSPKLYLVLVLLALGAYLFWLTREQLAAMQIKKRGSPTARR